MNCETIFWRDLTKIIKSSKCTVGEKKQFLDCLAKKLNISQTSSWNEQSIIADTERIVAALKKDTELTGGVKVEKELNYMVEWNICSRAEERELLQKYNMKKEEGITVGSNKKLSQKDNKKVFIVHGHDESLKYNVCSWLYELGLEPIILHEQANGGIKGVLQKIKDNSDVACAIILMTADDEGKAVTEANYNKRARQNVVFEAGYFIGKLGEDRVIILQEEGIERPSDIEECIYIVADKYDGWRDKVRKEFKSMGITYRV